MVYRGNISMTEQIVKGWITGYDQPDFYQGAIVPEEMKESIGIISVVDMDEKNRENLYGILDWK